MEFKDTDFCTFYGSYLLNTKLLKVPCVGFSVAGLDHTKFLFYQFQRFLFIVVIVKSLHFHKFQFISNYWCSYRTRKKKCTFKAIEKYRYGLWKTVSKRLNRLKYIDKVVLGRKSVFIWQLASILSYLVRQALTFLFDAFHSHDIYTLASFQGPLFRVPRREPWKRSWSYAFDSV